MVSEAKRPGDLPAGMGNRPVIKAIVFDFDGVLAESADIKTRAFELLFSSYPERLSEIVRYHQENGGISRFVKFRHIYHNILGKELSSDEERKLGEEFSAIVLDQVLKAPPVPGALEFLRNYKNTYAFFIASGTPDDELKTIVAGRRLAQFFREVRGAPAGKAEIIGDIQAKYGLRGKEVAFVGDAESDRDAAGKAGVRFVARLTPGSSLEDCQWHIDDLTELAQVLKNIQKKGD